MDLSRARQRQRGTRERDKTCLGASEKAASERAGSAGVRLVHGWAGGRRPRMLDAGWGDMQDIRYTKLGGYVVTFRGIWQELSERKWIQGGQTDVLRFEYS